jgi:hypothetical protein
MELSWRQVLLIRPGQEVVIVFCDKASRVCAERRIRTHKRQHNVVWLPGWQAIGIKLVKVLFAHSKTWRIGIRIQLSQAHFATTTIAQPDAQVASSAGI